MKHSGLWLILHTLVLAALLVCLIPRHLAGQVMYGSLVGSVVDASEGAVPGALVKVKHIETNQSREIATNDAGVYSFATIPIGTYEVVISKEGFQTFIERNINVTLNTTVRVNARLQVGSVSEQVQVLGQTGTLQTDRSDVRNEVTATQLTNVPIPTRSFASAFVTIPGMTPPGTNTNAVCNPSQSMQYEANGTSQSGTNVRIDGITATNLWIQFLSSYTPALESIETVNVVTAAADAEQGLAAGAAVNVVLKSGTNALHGSVFEYHTNKAFKARPTFLPPDQTMPKYLRNTFGGTVGGPIKKDKLFYFVSWEALKDRRNSAGFATIPTDAIRSGDMSASPNPIYDPATGNPDGSGRSPFYENRVPKTKMSSIVRDKIIPLLPKPMYSGLTNNYYGSPIYNFDSHKVDAKFNWNAAQALSFSGRVSALPFKEYVPTFFGELVGPPSQSGTRDGLIFSTTQTVSYVARPTLIIDGYFGFTNPHTYSMPPGMDKKYGEEVLGIPGSNGPSPKEWGMPQINVSNYTFLGRGYEPLEFWDPTYQWVGNINWIKGTHNIRFGFDMNRLHMNHYEISPTSNFSFTGGVTSLLGGKSPNQFNSYADFLLGLPASYARGKMNGDYATMRMWMHNLYIRDQWQVSRKLTVTYGTRWEYHTVPTRADRGIELFDPVRLKQLICGVGPNPGDCGIQVSKKLFSPTLGFAFRPTETFVIRAGYAINWSQQLMFRDGIYNYPAALSASFAGPNTYQPVSRLEDGMKQISPPDISSGVLDLPAGALPITLPKDFKRGYVQSWNLTLQKSLPAGLVAQAGYVATRTIRQMTYWNMNYGLPGGGRASQKYYQLAGLTGEVVSLEPLQHMKYDSLQTSLQRRFANGIQFNAQYTFSKWLGMCCDVNADRGLGILIPQYFNLNRSVLPGDRTHAFAMTGAAELPFGKAKQWFKSGLASALLGGWSINGVFVAYSGTPFTVSSSSTSLNAPGNPQHADQVKKDVQIIGGTGPGESWFDPLAFAPVTEARFGTSGFNILRGPGLGNLDASLFRDFRLTERFKLQFRAEAMNATNTPHFANPGTNVSNMTRNLDGSLNLNGYTEIRSVTSVGREGVGERFLRFGLRISF